MHFKAINKAEDNKDSWSYPKRKQNLFIIGNVIKHTPLQKALAYQYHNSQCNIFNLCKLLICFSF